MKKRIAVAIAVAAATTLVAGPAVLTARPQTTEAAPAAAAQVPEWLVKASRSASAEYGETQPASLSWALTTTGAAKAVELGESRPVDMVGGEAPCYVAIVTGGFTFEGARGLGDRQLKGDVIELIYDPETFERTDMMFFEGEGALDASAISGLQTVQWDAAASIVE